MNAATKESLSKKKPPVTVHVNFPDEVVKELDALAEVESRTRVNMIQVLVKQGLEARREETTA